MTYRALIEQWLEETDFYANPDEAIAHPNIAQIRAGGRKAIKAILDVIDGGEGNVFLADLLRDLTGEEEVTAQTPPGDVEAMLEAWVLWGIENGYLAEVDPGEDEDLSVSIEVAPPDTVLLVFPSEVRIMGLTPDAAEQLAEGLVESAKTARHMRATMALA